MSLLHPSLRTLMRLKTRGWLRSQRQRLRRPTAVILLLITLGFLSLPVFLLWLPNLGELNEPLTPQRAQQVARLVITLLVLVGALVTWGHRGLYLPPQEVERLLAAPLRRSQLVRYRLLGTLLRSWPFGLMLAFFASRNLPHAGFGFAGAFLAYMLIPITTQFASLALVALGDRVENAFQRVPVVLPRIIAAFIAWGVVVVVMLGPGSLAKTGADDALQRVLTHPASRIVSWPATPWAKAASATDVRTFSTWFAVAFALTVLLFEVTARLRVDFRAHTLRTATEVSKRLANARAGRGLMLGTAQTVIRAPWWAGTGPMGAILWLRSTFVLRHLRRQWIVVIVQMMVAVGIGIFNDGRSGNGSITTGFFALLYMGLVCRVDLRGDLDRMTHVRSWPLSSHRVFLASVLPVAMTVAALSAIAILIKSSLSDRFGEVTLICLAVLPPTALFWLVIDNLVFLHLPVRPIPGQSGALHHVGQNLGSGIIRVLVLLAVAGVSVGTGFGVAALAGTWTDIETAKWIGGGVAVVMTCLALWVLTLLGGRALRRFDLASAQIEVG